MQKRINNDIVFSRQVFLHQARRLGDEIMNLLLEWEKLTPDDNGLTSIKNPFNMSFDEFFAQYQQWYGVLEDNFLKTEYVYSPTVTVGELKEVIKYIPDETQVVVYDEKNDWWLNVETIDLPDNDGMFTVTFNTVNTFDPRQF